MSNEKRAILTSVRAGFVLATVVALQIGCAPPLGGGSTSERAEPDRATDRSYCTAKPSLNNLASASQARLWELYGHYKLCAPANSVAAQVVLNELVERSDPNAQHEAALLGWRNEPGADNSWSISMFKRAAANGSTKSSRALEEIERGEFP